VLGELYLSGGPYDIIEIYGKIIPAPCIRKEADLKIPCYECGEPVEHVRCMPCDDCAVKFSENPEDHEARCIPCSKSDYDWMMSDADDGTDGWRELAQRRLDHDSGFHENCGHTII
jgi:hypothetical protein